MDVLIVEPLDPDVLQWLAARHAVLMAPELVHDAAGFQHALAFARRIRSTLEREGIAVMATA